MDEKPTPSFSAYRKVLAVLASGALLLHVMFILLLTFLSSPEQEGKSIVVRAYQHFVHIGPFFREDAIKASQRLISGYMKNGEWNYINMTDSLVGRYLNNPWKTQELSVRDRIRESARGLVNKKGWRSSSDFRKLHQYAKSRHPEIKDSDSLSFIFITRWYQPELKQHVPDTLFHLKFSPSHE